MAEDTTEAVEKVIERGRCLMAVWQSLGQSSPRSVAMS